MPRRTGLGHDLFERTLGFRLYMNSAEKAQQKFAEAANLFTRYLPYAIVFGMRPALGARVPRNRHRPGDPWLVRGTDTLPM